MSVRGLTEDEVKAKYVRIMNLSMNELDDGYWSGMTFDGWPVVSTSIDAGNAPSPPFDDYDTVKQFLAAKLKDLRKADSPWKQNLEELKFLLKHCDRRRNELIFMKCTSPSCLHCSSKPIVAVEAMKFIRENGGTLFSPLKSTQHPDHYHTFLEMVDLSNEQLPTPDQYQPTFMAQPLGRCPRCPSYTFSSQAEKQRHCAVVHQLTPKQTADLDSGAGVVDVSLQRWPCKFKVRGAMCGIEFRTKRDLQKHKEEEGHKRKGRVQAAAVIARAERKAAEESDDSGRRDEEEDEEREEKEEEGKYQVSDEEDDAEEDDAEEDDAEEDDAEEDDDTDIEEDCNDNGGAANEDGVVEGEGYEWIPGVAKDHRIAHMLADEFCRRCDREIEPDDSAAARVIECNMCNFVWCCECLDPPITPTQCATNSFFACSSGPNGCVTEAKQKLARRKRKRN
jgi:hypothetical protein